MTGSGKAVDRIFRDALEIEIDPGVSVAGSGPSERHERQPGLLQEIHTFVYPSRRGNDHRIHHAARHHALQIFIRILFPRTGQNDEIEIMSGKHALQTVRHTEEKVVGVLHGLRVAAGHQADDIGGSLPEATAGLVGDITQLFRRFQNTPPRFFVHIRLAVQGTGNSAYRYLQIIGKLTNSFHALPSQARRAIDAPLNGLDISNIIGIVS